MSSIFAAFQMVLALGFLVALTRWRIFPAMGLCVLAAHAQSTNVHRVNITISANGTYTSSDKNVTMIGTGEATLFGDVKVTVGLQVVDEGVCNAQFTFASSTGLNQTIYGVQVSAGIAAFTAHSPNQGCANGKDFGGIQKGVAFIDPGQLGAGGTEFVEIDSGIFTYALLGNGTGGDAGTWSLYGQGEIGLVTAPVMPGQNGSPAASGSYPAVIAGPGGSGYPLVSNGADGGSALVFDGSGSGSADSAGWSAPAGGGIPRAQAGSSDSIQIILPVQSASASYTASASCSNAPTDCWITIPTASGTVSAGSAATVTANVSSPAASPGVYPANIAITINPSGSQSPSPTALNVPLTAIVNTASPVLAISQTGLQFQAISGTGELPPQSVSVSNQGSGSLSFSASVSTLSGGNWLTVSPVSGIATSSPPGTISIQANPAGLAPGVYFGRVDFAAQAASNSPQSVEVALTVLAVSATPAAAVSPSGLNFIANGGANPTGQKVQISNLSNQPLMITSSAFVEEATNWLNVTPSSGIATSTQPLVETMAVNVAGLTPGVHNGVVLFEDSADNTTYSIAVQLIVAQSTGCTPTQLLPLFTNLGDSFQATSGLPAPLEAEIFDDCGAPLTAGSVVSSFSTGDPSVSMTPTGNGQWAGTWMPGNLEGSAASVTLSAFSSTAGGLQGSAVISGALSANPTAPFVNLSGVVSAASLAANVPIAPGSYISIFGSNLASAAASAQSLPLPTTLNETQVLLGGQPLPLNFVGPGQINAIVPSGPPVNTLQQLMVIQKGVYSLPQTLVVAEAQPAVFTQNQSGTGAGVIVVAKADGTQFLNTSSSPASTGDALVIYCAGLGAVNPPVPEGMPGPSSPLSHTANSVNVTVGGQAAQVLYAGLAPGFAGLYQVNVILPPGITAATDVPLVLSVAGQNSPPVTLAVQ
jgi:uncharacterized protein (TIGR03437 family)